VKSEISNDRREKVKRSEKIRRRCADMINIDNLDEVAFGGTK
jgi:hypothetical protein